MRIPRAVPAALALLALAVPARPDDAPAAEDVLARWRPPLRAALGVREVSAMALLEETDGAQELLLVSDEGRYVSDARTVADAIFRASVAVGADGTLRVSAAQPIALALGPVAERLDPECVARAANPLDLEGITPIPGVPHHFLLTGERNPEDVTDNGANRAYVVRYPSPGPARAEVVAYFRIPDLMDDLGNDRFEGVAAIAKDETSWDVWFFKERTAFPDRRVTFLHAGLHRRGEQWTLLPDVLPGWPPVKARTFSERPGEVASQADACAGPDGEVWVLDRWNRILHRVKPAPDGALARLGSIDLYPALEAVPQERSPLGSPAPAYPGRPGFGRHEAMALDPRGRLWIAADLGDGSPSPLTLLVPR